MEHFGCLLRLKDPLLPTGDKIGEEGRNEKRQEPQPASCACLTLQVGKRKLFPEASMLSSSIAAVLIPFQNFLPADIGDGGKKKKKKCNMRLVS